MTMNNNNNNNSSSNSNKEALLASLMGDLSMGIAESPTSNLMKESNTDAITSTATTTNTTSLFPDDDDDDSQHHHHDPPTAAAATTGAPFVPPQSLPQPHQPNHQEPYSLTTREDPLPFATMDTAPLIHPNNYGGTNPVPSTNTNTSTSSGVVDTDALPESASSSRSLWESGLLSMNSAATSTTTTAAAAAACSGTNSSGGGGGLFDEIDQEQQQQQQQQRALLEQQRQKQQQQQQLELQQQREQQQQQQARAMVFHNNNMVPQQLQPSPPEILPYGPVQDRSFPPHNLVPSTSSPPPQQQQTAMGQTHPSVWPQQQYPTQKQPPAQQTNPPYYQQGSSSYAMPGATLNYPTTAAANNNSNIGMMGMIPNQSMNLSASYSPATMTSSAGAAPLNPHIGGMIADVRGPQPTMPNQYPGMGSSSFMTGSVSATTPSYHSNQFPPSAPTVGIPGSGTTIPPGGFQSPQPSFTAGMHNVNPQLGRVPNIQRSMMTGSVSSSIMPPTTTTIQPRAALPPQPIIRYGTITVDQPLLLSSSMGMPRHGAGGVGGGGGGGIVSSLWGSSPHWSYQITTQIPLPSMTQPDQPNQPPPPPPQLWFVRRRFRHVVALEDRLREDCPGAILPPRPDKHPTRAIEEASTQQSTEFAIQRAAELEVYLNQLAQHPIASQSSVLRFFLSLQDDLGAAWPEVSSNAFTRLATVSVGTAVKVSEHAREEILPDAAEDSAELLALYASESVRMGSVQQAVPKLEGSVTLLREHSEASGAAGMEMGRLAKEEFLQCPELDSLATGWLRSGRRSKRLALELSAALHTFVHQYKLCRYERAAFGDRRSAMHRRSKERKQADQRAAQLYQQQYRQPAQYYNPHLNRLEQEASYHDTMASDAVRECDEIGNRLKSEVHRIAWQRKTEWKSALKVMASAMKEAASERVAIWQSVLDAVKETG